MNYLDNSLVLPLEELKILRLPDVKMVTGLGRSSIYQMMAEGAFPRAVSLGSRAIGWRLGDIKAWLISRQPIGQVVVASTLTV